MMRPNEIYTGDIELDGTFLRPGYAGSLDNLAKWAYEIHQTYPDNKLKIIAKKVIFIKDSHTRVDIPPLDKSETQEVLELESQGELAHIWLFTTLGLIRSFSPNIQSGDQA